MKLSDLFIGWYDYPEKEYNDILKNGLISFDTNVLLNMYRYSKKASTETFNALNKIKDRIIISYYVAKEFTNNRKKVKVDNIREYESLSKLIEDKFSDINVELNKYGEKKLSNILDIINVLKDSEDKVINFIEDEKKIKSDFYKNNEIEKNISEIFLNKIAPEYKGETLKKVKEEGLRRFSEEIPPGYMDKEKEENGDYYIFKSLIDYCKKHKKDLILITNDKKEDWFRNISGIKEPREELLSEFYKETEQKLLIFDFDVFIKNDNIFKQKISPDVVNEIYEINKLQEERMVNRRMQRILRYFISISKFNTIYDLKKNLDEVKSNYRNLIRICDFMHDEILLRKVEELNFLLCEGKYDEYIKLLNKFNLQMKNYKVESENKIKKIYRDFKEEESANIGLIFLEKIYEYIRDYLDPTFNNRMLLSKARNLRISKRNNLIENEIFIKEINNIYDTIFNIDSNELKDEYEKEIIHE